MDIVFYSNFCMHSRALINKIESKNMKNKFVFVCIDHNNTRDKLPKFVDRVPIIYLVESRSVLMDSSIDIYMSSLSSPPPIQENTDVNGFNEVFHNSGISDSFGFIDENSHLLNANFNYVNRQDEQPQLTENYTETISKSNKFDEDRYKNFVAQRDADEKYFKNRV